MSTVPYVLSPDDSAQAAAFARHIMQQAHPADRMRISRFGMDIFHSMPILLENEIEYLSTLYCLRIPGLHPLMDTLGTDNDRATAIERTIALNVHQLCTGRALAVQSFGVSHE
jgi:hypothetical protein